MAKKKAEVEAPPVAAEDPGADPPAEPKAPREMVLRDDGTVTAEVMRKVFGQSDRLDKGPTERRLRDLLKKGVRPYLDLMEELEGRTEKESRREAEVARLRAENAELTVELSRLKSAAEGSGEEAEETRRARAQIERILAEHHE